MYVNASINFLKVQPNNSITGHITRSPQHINNENINSVISKYNYYYNCGNSQSSYDVGHFTGSDADRKKLISKLDRHYYGKQLKQKNIKAKQQHHLKRVKSLSKYMNSGARKHRTELMVATLGHNERQRINQIIEQKYWQMPKSRLKDKIRKAYASALRYYGNHWNERHSHLKCVGFGVNVDEVKQYDGSPHIHLILYNAGKTRKGKPSPSLSSAIKAETGIHNNRKALSTFHKTESEQLLDDFQNILNQRFQHLNLNFSYKPTGSKITGLSMPQYKKTVKKNDAKLAKQRHQIQQNHQRIQRLRKQRNNLRASKNYYQGIIKHFVDVIKKVVKQYDWHGLKKLQERTDKLSQHKIPSISKLMKILKIKPKDTDNTLIEPHQFSKQSIKPYHATKILKEQEPRPQRQHYRHYEGPTI